MSRPPFSRRFALLRFPLDPFRELEQRLPDGAKTGLRVHLRHALFPVRLLRYWWAGQALLAESKRLGRPLTVVDLGCERGWLKHFTPVGAVDRWIGLDWRIQKELGRIAKYDEVHTANFDGVLPVESGRADAVVSLHVFEHLPRPGSTIAEVARILKPGGIFLAAAPTMPHWLAGFRERYFRRRLQRGELTPGGHITVLSPTRWNQLARDTGLDVEFSTGSHAVRITGNFLENHRWWVRLNQFWGGLFPSLGSECCVQARRENTWVGEPVSLYGDSRNFRGAWIAFSAAAALAVATLAGSLVNHVGSRTEYKLDEWLNAHQSGDDVFLMSRALVKRHDLTRTDVRTVDTYGELPRAVEELENAHVLVSENAALTLVQADPHHWQIHSRLELTGMDYVLLKRLAEGTPLREYLRGNGGVVAHRPPKQNLKPRLPTPSSTMR